MRRGDGLLTHDLDPQDRGPQDACGVFGVWAPGEEVAKLTYFGLYALQHRGQESAGIAVSDGNRTLVCKEMGLVSQVFDEPDLNSLQGLPRRRPLPLLHHRCQRLEERPADVPADRDRRDRARPQRQPDQRRRAAGLAGRARRREPVTGSAARLANEPTTDTALITALLATYPGPDASRQAAMEVLPQLRGAFSLVFMDEETLYAARDPQGIRPLVLGRLERGWVVASETAALDIVGASFIREIEPGELIAIDATGLRSRSSPSRSRRAASSSTSTWPARTPRSPTAGVHAVRVEVGRTLAREHPVEADLVIPVPESGTPAAIGYAEAVRHPVRAGPGQELLRRTDVHPAQPDHPPARHPAQAEPAARRDRRQAAGGRRRLDRPRQHPARPGPDAPRGRCERRCTCGSPRRR